MIEISMDGNAAEGFAGRIDYATYQYFEENGISMSNCLTCPGYAPYHICSGKKNGKDQH